MNAGCRYITGFCNFQHDIGKLTYRKKIWEVIEKFQLGYKISNFLRKLPRAFMESLDDKFSLFGTMGACMFPYRISCMESIFSERKIEQIKEKIALKYFCLFYNIDTCGACSLYELRKFNISHIKIVGRGYSLNQKIRDTKFIRNSLDYLEKKLLSECQFREYVQGEYADIYDRQCKRTCYFFNKNI